MKAPRPHLTSRTRASAPSASFFDIILAAISGIFFAGMTIARAPADLPADFANQLKAVGYD